MAETIDLLDGLDVDIPSAAAVGSAAGGGAGEPAEFFGPYQLIQQVGAGGVAQVYRARHIHPSYADKTFALKVLQHSVSQDPQVVSLFRAEAFVLSLLKHPAIVQTFEAGSQDGKLFIAMEYVDGRNLDSMLMRCQEHGIKVPLPLAMHFIGESLKALTYAHDLSDSEGEPLNLVHRDVNPANVFLSYDGRVKLGDFGVASIVAGRMEKERELAGKVGYFAPEQLEGKPIDRRADLFATGVMMFELLTGQRLFEADTADKMMRLNKRAKIPKPSKINPEIPPEVEAAMLRALERRPNDRYADGREMLAALDAHIPPPGGMPLAVAAMMRKVFLSEHIRELQLNEGLAGGSHDRGSGQTVAVYSTDPRAQAAFNELLTSRGYRVVIAAALDALAQNIAVQPPHVALVDVNSQQFDSARTAAVLKNVSQPFPVVGVSNGLDLRSVHDTNAIGGVDLLFKPFNVERVLSSVRAAVTGAAKVARLDPTGVAVNTSIKPKVLLLSKDPALITGLTNSLLQYGYSADVSPTSTEALQRTEYLSYHAIIYDANPATPADRFFASHFRARPGMGLVPILYLADEASHGIFAGIENDRNAVCVRSGQNNAVVETLNRLRGNTRLGRSFIRYAVAFRVEVRYGGRVFEGVTEDLSRGGMMVRCDQMPPVGTEIGAKLDIKPESGESIQVTGRITRVAIAKEGAGAGLGIEFESFAGRGEADLIAFLTTLDNQAQSAPQRTTIITAPRDTE